MLSLAIRDVHHCATTQFLSEENTHRRYRLYALVNCNSEDFFRCRATDDRHSRGFSRAHTADDRSGVGVGWSEPGTAWARTARAQCTAGDGGASEHTSRARDAHGGTYSGDAETERGLLAHDGREEKGDGEVLTVRGLEQTMLTAAKKQTAA